MRKFMKEYSKAVLVVFLCLCSAVILAYEVQVFIALFTDAAKPDTAVPSLAFTAGFSTILGSFVKSFLEKNSLNKNGLKITDTNDIVKIESESRYHDDDSDETPEE
jgi:membrane protein YqaA with SNARE-associated domain